MPAFILTDSRVPKNDPERRYIKTLPIPETGKVFYTDLHKDAPKRLMLCVNSNGSMTWVLHYYFHGKARRITLGKYPSWGPVRARIEATAKRSEIDSKTDPLETRKDRKQARLDAEAAKRAKAELTLGALLTAYVAQMKRDGKSSAKAVENSLNRNVKELYRHLWDTPAADLDVDDFLDIIVTLTDAGKRREAAKLRSYLRAAYSAAVKARTSPDATPALRKFRLKTNPVSDLAPIAESMKPRKRALSEKELQVYWKRVTELSDPDGAALRLHLLTGGQRLEQLFRAQTRDLDGDDLILQDPKGRRQQPRTHLVPLLKESKEAIEAMGEGPYLLSFDGGKSPSTDGMFRRRVKTVCDAMLEDEEVKERFTPGDIRRTVETRLGAAGIPSDHLKHLLSHGFGGVQDRHYQVHDYKKEKLAALKALHNLLTPRPSKVAQIKRKRA